MVDIALMLVLLDCGLRRSEAAALVWPDIGRRDNGTGRLLAERSRTGQTGEVVLITRWALAGLDQIQQPTEMRVRSSSG